MAKCGCKGSSCSCKVVAGRGARVTGAGTGSNPIVVEAFPMALAVQNSGTVAITLSGTGTEADPSTVSADLIGPAITGKWGLWRGTQAEYNALGSYDANTLYFIPVVV